MTTRDEMLGAIEAVLFVASGPVTPDKIVALFPDEERADARAALDTVLDRYREGEGRGIAVDHAAGGVRVVTRPEYDGYLRKFFDVSSRSRLSTAALETLAIIAYRQPITAPEIAELRGVNSAGVLKTLLDHRLTRIAGRKEVVGKPFLYCTSKEFLLRFGLNRLEDLPPLEEIQETLSAELEEGVHSQGELPEEGPEVLFWSHTPRESDASEEPRFAAEETEDS